MTEGQTLTVMREFRASSDRVFDAWLDPAQARHFLFATSDGTMLTCEIDARVGGEALIVERRPDREVGHRLRFEEIERPRRLVMQFRAGTLKDLESDTGWTRVTIEIAPTDTGCRLVLTHEGVWAGYEKQTRNGWTTTLENLAGRLE